MKNQLQRLLNYIVKKGADILELLNQNYFKLFYGILMINLILVCFLFYKKLYIVSFLIMLTLIIILKIENLIKIGEINLYDKMNKKILILNIILLMLNIINIFFNVFRYLFYDVIKIIREYMRNLLLDYFKIEITTKIDYYVDNIVAYISFEVIWITIGLLIYMYILYIGNKYFDWNREILLINNDELKAKLFWTHKNSLLCIIYVYSYVFIICFFVVILLKNFNIINVDSFLFNFLIYLNMLSVIVFLIYHIQFEYNYYKFHWKKNKEYLKWKT